MKNLLLAFILLGCSVPAAAPVATNEPAPYANPARSDACEVEAQTVSQCPDLKAEPCEGFWIAYDSCMIAAE